MYIKNSLALALAALVTTTIAAPTVERSPQADRYIPTQITWFGERPAFSPNGSKVAFMSKSYGDAFEYDLETQHVNLVTHFPNSGYLRVQYLLNGDLLLIGARTFEGFAETRERLMEMWVLHPGSTKPVALNHKIWEGVAISSISNIIAWANTNAQYPDIPEGVSIIYTGNIVYSDGIPTLTNKREVLRGTAPECEVEPQDFRNDDTELIYSCYRVTKESRQSEVRGVNLSTGEVTIYRAVPGEYNEVEGIYPSGEFTLVESAHDQPDPDDNFGIEIWRLRLEPNSADFVRLTWFADTPGLKAGNPVVSPDGTTMAVQLSHSLDEPPGAGYGLFLVDLS